MIQSSSPRVFAEPSAINIFQRWMAVLFLWAVLVGAIVCLSFAAIAGV